MHTICMRIAGEKTTRNKNHGKQSCIRLLVLRRHGIGRRHWPAGATPSEPTDALPAMQPPMPNICSQHLCPVCRNTWGHSPPYNLVSGITSLIMRQRQCHHAGACAIRSLNDIANMPLCSRCYQVTDSPRARHVCSSALTKRLTAAPCLLPAQTGCELASSDRWPADALDPKQIRAQN